MHKFQFPEEEETLRLDRLVTLRIGLRSAPAEARIDRRLSESILR